MFGNILNINMGTKLHISWERVPNKIINFYLNLFKFGKLCWR